MLETPKDLNIIIKFYKFKYETMDNQQETKLNYINIMQFLYFKVGSSETIRKAP